MGIRFLEHLVYRMRDKVSLLLLDVGQSTARTSVRTDYGLQP